MQWKSIPNNLLSLFLFLSLSPVELYLHSSCLTRCQFLILTLFSSHYSRGSPHLLLLGASCARGSLSTSVNPPTWLRWKIHPFEKRSIVDADVRTASVIVQTLLRTRVRNLLCVLSTRTGWLHGIRCVHNDPTTRGHTDELGSSHGFFRRPGPGVFPHQYQCHIWVIC